MVPGFIDLTLNWGAVRSSFRVPKREPGTGSEKPLIPAPPKAALGPSSASQGREYLPHMIDVEAEVALRDALEKDRQGWILADRGLLERPDVALSRQLLRREPGDKVGEGAVSLVELFKELSKRHAGAPVGKLGLPRVQVDLRGVLSSRNALTLVMKPPPSAPQRCDTISLGDHRPSGAREAVVSSIPSQSFLNSPAFWRMAWDSWAPFMVSIDFPLLLRVFMPRAEYKTARKKTPPASIIGAQRPLHEQSSRERPLSGLPSLVLSACLGSGLLKKRSRWSLPPQASLTLGSGDENATSQIRTATILEAASPV